MALDLERARYMFNTSWSRGIVVSWSSSGSRYKVWHLDCQTVGGDAVVKASPLWPVAVLRWSGDTPRQLVTLRSRRRTMTSLSSEQVIITISTAQDMFSIRNMGTVSCKIIMH